MLYARVSITLTFSGQKREFIESLITSLTNLEHFYVNWNEKKLTKNMRKEKIFRKACAHTEQNKETRGECMKD